MTSPLIVAGVQMDVTLAKPEQNRTRIEERLRQAVADHQPNLVVFPECAITGYCFKSLEEARPFAETLPGPTTKHFARVCKELNVFMVLGLLEADGERVFNVAVMLGPQGLVGSYRKIHLPSIGVDHFTTPGDRPFAITPADDLKVGMSICYDAGFPEATRCLALQGADLIVLPTNWPPGAECVAEHVIATRAMENKVYMMAVNRVGRERGFQFIGRSSICDPDGGIIASAGDTEEIILVAEIDVERARKKYVERAPGGQHSIDRFKDRRPEMYGPVVE
jgi:predicted amidohydrolase